MTIVHISASSFAYPRSVHVITSDDATLDVDLDALRNGQLFLGVDVLRYKSVNCRKVMGRAQWIGPSSWRVVGGFVWIVVAAVTFFAIELCGLFDIRND